MVTQDALERGTDPLDGRAAARVECVGADGDAEHVPVLECVGEQQQFRLGVQRRALGVGGQPGASDLHLGGRVAVGVPGDVEVPRATHRLAVGRSHLGEGHDGVASSVGQKTLDVGRHVGE